MKVFNPQVVNNTRKAGSAEGWREGEFSFLIWCGFHKTIVCFGLITCKRLKVNKIGKLVSPQNFRNFIIRRLPKEQKMILKFTSLLD